MMYLASFEIHDTSCKMHDASYIIAIIIISVIVIMPVIIIIIIIIIIIDRTLSSLRLLAGLRDIIIHCGFVPI